VEVECFNIIAVRVCVPWEGRLAIRNISAVVISIRRKQDRTGMALAALA
jgi:hypothetical protein